MNLQMIDLFPRLPLIEQVAIIMMFVVAVILTVILGDIESMVVGE
jgi:hypothetical protein